MKKTLIIVSALLLGATPAFSSPNSPAVNELCSTLAGLKGSEMQDKSLNMAMLTASDKQQAQKNLRVVYNQCPDAFNDYGRFGSPVKDILMTNYAPAVKVTEEEIDAGMSTISQDSPAFERKRYPVGRVCKGVAPAC